MIFENIRYMNILQKLSLGVMAFPVMQVAYAMLLLIRKPSWTESA